MVTVTSPAIPKTLIYLRGLTTNTMGYVVPPFYVELFLVTTIWRVLSLALCWRGIAANITDTRGRPARCGSWAWTDIKKTAYKEESDEKWGSNTSLQKTAPEVAQLVLFSTNLLGWSNEVGYGRQWMERKWWRLKVHTEFWPGNLKWSLCALYAGQKYQTVGIC